MDPEDFDWGAGDHPKPLGSDDYSVLLIFLAFMAVIGITSGAVLLAGNAYTDYSESQRKKAIVDFRKDHNIDDLEKEMRPSKNAIMDDDDLADPVDTHEKLKLACLYTTDSPAATIGGAMCIDNETGYVYVFGGITKEDALRKNKASSSSDSTSDLHIYSSSERHWQKHPQNKEFGAPLNRAYHNMATIYNQVIVFGGLDPQTNQLHNEVFSFDHNNSAWVELNVKNHSPLPRATIGASAGASHAQEVRMPAPRYNCTMVPYGDSSFVIFGGKGRIGVSPFSGSDNDVVYIPEEVCYNDVWVLHAGHPEYLYYEELYTNNDTARQSDARAATVASTCTVDLYKQRCIDALSQLGASPLLTNVASANATGLASSANTDTDTNTTDFDAAASEVTTVAAGIVPLPREAHCAAILGNNMFVFGGATVNTIYTVSDSRTNNSSSNSNNSSSSSSRHHVTTSIDTAGVTVHDKGLVEVFDLGARVWCVCNTCGEHPIGELVGVTAHSLGNEANKIVLFSASTLVPTRHSIFNSVYVLDAALTTTATSSLDGTDSAPTSSLLLTWTRFMYNWLGDWSVLPMSRVFYSASVDMEEGLIYVFGGYQNYDDNNVDITIANGDPTVPKSNGTDGNFRNSVRMNRLSKLNKKNFSIANSLKAGVNGNIKVANVVSEICIVDISALMFFEDPSDGEDVSSPAAASHGNSAQSTTAYQNVSGDKDNVYGRRDDNDISNVGMPWGDNLDVDLSQPRKLKLSRKDVPQRRDDDNDGEDELGNSSRVQSIDQEEEVGKEYYLTDSEEEEEGNRAGRTTERSTSRLLLIKKKKVQTKKPLARAGVGSHSSKQHSQK